MCLIFPSHTDANTRWIAIGSPGFPSSVLDVSLIPFSLGCHNIVDSDIWRPHIASDINILPFLFGLRLSHLMIINYNYYPLKIEIERLL